MIRFELQYSDKLYTGETIKAAQLTVSVDLLTFLLKVAGGKSLDTGKILAQCGLDANQLLSRSGRIPLFTFGSVWKCIMQQTGDPDFGLHFGEQVHKMMSGHLISSLMMSCSTIGQALQKNFLYHNLLTDMIRPGIRIKASLAYLGWDMAVSDLKHDRHFSESVCSILVSVLSQLTLGSCILKEVKFIHDQPSIIEEHQRIFRCPLRFNQVKNEIVIPREVLDQPVLLADKKLQNELENLVQRKLHDEYNLRSWADRISRLILSSLLQQKEVNLESIASDLNMSGRNLQYKLRNEETSFRIILDSVRKEVAFGFLMKQGMSISEIAYGLGFNDQSAFSHAFKRWTGLTPKDYRCIYFNSE